MMLQRESNPISRCIQHPDIDVFASQPLSSKARNLEVRWAVDDEAL